MHIKSDTPTLEILKLNSADQFGCLKQFMEKMKRWMLTIFYQKSLPDIYYYFVFLLSVVDTRRDKLVPFNINEPYKMNLS